MLQPAASPSSQAHAEAARIASDLRGGEWLHLLQEWGLKLLAAVLIFLIGRWLARRLSKGLGGVMGRAQVDSTLSGFLGNIAYAVMLVLVIMTALAAIGVPTTSMFAVLGAAGLAVGLALKDSLSNIASGVMLIVLRPFRAGDHVVIAGQEGIALEIRVFQTRLRAFDQRIIILPNSEITTAPIINHSTLPLRRMDVKVGVGYGDDLRQARELLLLIARQDPLVVDDPEPFVQVSNLADSSVELTLFAHAANADFGNARSQVIEAIRNQFTAAGLSIPFPQRDVYLHRIDAPASASARDTGAGTPG